MSGIGYTAWAFLKRDLRTARAYRFPFVLQLLGIIFGLVMYFFLGRLVQPSANPALRAYNADYFAFVLAGLAFFNCLYVGMSSFVEAVRNEQRNGTLEALLVCPTSPALALSGGVFWPIVQSLLYVGIYMIAGALFFHADWGRANWVSLILVLLLTLVQSGGLGLILAGAILIVKRGEGLLGFASGALGLLVGVYYPIEILPGPLRTLAEWLPLTRALQDLRNAAFDGASITAMWPDFALLILTGAALLALGLRWLDFALGRARERGSLTHF